MKIKLNFSIDVGTDIKPTEVTSLVQDLNLQILNNLILNKKVKGVEISAINKSFEYTPDQCDCENCTGCDEEYEDSEDSEDEEIEDLEDETEEDLEETEEIEYIDFSDVSTKELLEELKSRIFKDDE